MKKMITKLKPRISPLPEGSKTTDPDMLLATWFGSGCLRPGPGTMGTIAALPFGYLIQMYIGIPGMLIAIAAFFAIGVMVSNIYERKSGTHDSSTIVIDEVVGIWIAAIPAATHIGLWAVAFVLFRIFDIWKPWPISYLDRELPGGWGVMLDDVLAGFLAMCGTAVFAIPLLGVL